MDPSADDVPVATTRGGGSILHKKFARTSYKKFGKELLSHVGVFLTTTLGFIVAFSWNDAIRKETVDHRDEYGHRFITPWSFALIITIVSISILAIWTTFSVRNNQ